MGKTSRRLSWTPCTANLTGLRGTLRMRPQPVLNKTYDHLTLQERIFAFFQANQPFSGSDHPKLAEAENPRLGITKHRESADEVTVLNDSRL